MEEFRQSSALNNVNTLVALKRVLNLSIFLYVTPCPEAVGLIYEFAGIIYTPIAGGGEGYHAMEGPRGFALHLLTPEECWYEMLEKCPAQLGLEKAYPPRQGGVSNGSAVGEQWEPEWDLYHSQLAFVLGLPA
jgi:hypothetical protein